MRRREFRAMGSSILAILDTNADLPILQLVPQWFEEWEQALSRFRADSELSQLNSNRGAPRRVSETLWDVYLTALEADRLTGGLVNPLVLNAMVLAGYDRSFEHLKGDAAAPVATAEYDVQPFTECREEGLPALRSLWPEGTTRTLCMPPGAGLDLGGIGKGWAAHRAMQRLSVIGPALVSAGGDVAVSGPQANGEEWLIDIEDPRRPGEYLETLYLRHGGVATSGKDRRHWTRDGAPRHHIIDPRTRRPAQTDVLTATVIARTVMEAEALAKGVMISGSEAGLAWLDADEDVAAVLVLDDGQILYTRSIERYL